MTAAETLQQYLDTVAEATVRGDWETYAQSVIVPFTLETATATLVIRTSDDLADGFDTYAEMLADLRVTEMERKVVRAFSPEPDLIHGQYTTRLLAGKLQVAPMYWSQVRLERHEGRWKTPFIRNTTTDSRWPVLAPNVHRSISD